MNQLHFLSRRNKGFILIPIILSLTILAAVALLISREGVINTASVLREHQPENIKYVAEAGLAIGQKELKQDADCTGYAVTGSSSFNGTSYAASVTPDNGSPVTLNVSVDQGDGVSRQFSRTVKMYQPSEVLLDTAADAYIYEWNGSSNYGSAELLHINGPLLAQQRSLLFFDLSGQSFTGAQIISSSLELYLVGSPESDMEQIGVFALEKQWNEAQVTWQQRTSSNWLLWGGDYNLTEITSTLVDENSPGLYSWNISSLSKDWLDGVTSNDGVILKAATINNNNKEFASSEYITDTSKRPRLRIAYHCECGHGSSGSATIKPASQGVDTYLASGGQASVNHGAYANLVVSEQTVNKEHALLRFDIAGLPAGASITSANLELDFQTAGGTGFGDIRAHRVLVPWTEMLATWNAPAGGSPWTTPGGDYTLTAEASAAVDGFVPGLTSWNLTSLVADWYAGTYSNEGILLTASSGLNNANFTSSDAADASQHPRLSIDFTCPCGVACIYTPPPLPYGTRLLLVVADAASLSAEESLRKNLIESWGFSVSLISASDSQATFDAAVAVKDVVYISETVSAASVGTKLTSAAIGVVNEQRNLSDEFGLSSNSSQSALTTITIADNSHYISEVFPLGSLVLFTSSQQGTTMNGTLAPGLQVLGEYGAQKSLGAVAQGATLDGGGTAAGRRVQLPWGDSSGFDPASLTDSAKIMMRRAIEWSAGAGADTGFSGMTLAAIADSFMKSDDPTANSGDHNDIIVNSKSNFINHALLQFDTAAIAPLTPVTNAKLRLWVRDNRSNSNANIELHKVTYGWKENEVSWNLRKVTKSWAAAGGDYDATVIDTQMLPGFTNKVWLEWDITTLVQEWVDSPTSNNGVLLKTDVAKAIKFSAKETTDPADHPQLIITTN